MNIIREKYQVDLDHDYAFNDNEYQTVLEIIKEQGVPMLSELNRYQKRVASALTDAGAIILPVRCGENVWVINWTQSGYVITTQVVEGIYIGADNKTLNLRTSGSGQSYIWGEEAFHTKNQAIAAIKQHETKNNSYYEEEE